MIINFNPNFSRALTISIKLSPNENWFCVMFNGTWNFLLFREKNVFCLPLYYDKTTMTKETTIGGRREGKKKSIDENLRFLGSENAAQRLFPPNFHDIFVVCYGPRLHFVSTSTLSHIICNRRKHRDRPRTNRKSMWWKIVGKRENSWKALSYSNVIWSKCEQDKNGKCQK